MSNFTSTDLEALGVILTVYGIFFAFIGVLGIICYIFQSIGLQRMAKNLQLRHSWFAWIPLLSTYLFGKIGSQYIKKDGKRSAKFGGWLIGLDIVAGASGIGMLVSIIFLIISGISMETSGANAPTGAFVGSFAACFVTYFLLIGTAIAFAVVYYIALWRVFAIFDNSTATAFLVISIFFSVATPFLLFAVRNNRPCVTYAERVGFIPQTAPVVENSDTAASVNE